MCARDRSPAARAALIGRFKDVQSGAYAPPKRLPTRSPPITQDLTIPLAAAHTLTRVTEAKPRRRGPPASTQPRRQRRPPLWRALTFLSSVHTSPAGVLHGGGHKAPQRLGGTPGLVVEAAPLRSLCQSSSRRRAGRSKEALPLFSPASRARRRAHASLVHHQDTKRQAEQAASNFSTPRSPAPFKLPATAVWRVGPRS